MKKINKFRILLLSFVCAASFGCADILNTTPESQLMPESFFKDDAQVLMAGASLYNATWYYFDNVLRLYTEILAGNALGGGSQQAFQRFEIGADELAIAEGYNSLYVTIAAANTLLDNLERNAGAGVSEDILNGTKAEALCMRALAHFFLVRLWGPAPLVNDMSIYTENKLLKRTTVEGLYRFIQEDLLEAESLALETHPARGRVCKATCQALLAKVYLTLRDYPKAASYAKKVIDNSNYSLLENYAAIGQQYDDNGTESILQFQWQGCIGWTMGSVWQAYLVPGGSNITGVGDGWGMVMPSKDLAATYEAGDLRRKPTIMMNGDHYPELKSAEGGYTYDEILTNGATHMHFRKFIVGAPSDGYTVCSMSTSNNTTVVRLGDIYLMYAEAILANNATTTDAEALKYFNLIRTRAGLSPKSVLDKSTILKERRIELACEGEYWFDLLRLDVAEALEIIRNQDRGYWYSNGTVSLTPPRFPYLFPIPGPEIDKDPLLKEEPVGYPN